MIQALTAEVKGPKVVSNTTLVGETMILDKVILDQVLSMMKKMEVPKFTFVGDRGFYSDYNLELLPRGGYKFTIPVPSNVAWQMKLIADHRDTLVRPDNLIEDNGSIMYGKTIYKTTLAHGRTWYHLYFDPARKEKVIASFMQKLRRLKDELEADKPVERHRAMYDRYFIVKNTLVRGRLVNDNDEAIQEFFVTFISLIILARLRKMVDQIDKKKRKYWSEHDMQRKVETYARVYFEGKYKEVYTTSTAAQRIVFDLFGIPFTFNGRESTPEGER